MTLRRFSFCLGASVKETTSSLFFCFVGYLESLMSFASLVFESLPRIASFLDVRVRDTLIHLSNSLGVD